MTKEVILPQFLTSIENSRLHYEAEQSASISIHSYFKFKIKGSSMKQYLIVNRYYIRYCEAMKQKCHIVD